MGFFEVFSAALTGFYALIPSFGLAIILLTVAVRLLLLPLSIKQTRSMREMQRIQPEVKKLQQKYKGDRQKMNEELMALYKEHGVNPFGGCAPLLFQFPVLIGLFYVIRTPLNYMGFGPPPSCSDEVTTACTPSGLVAAPADFVARNVSGVLDTLQNSRLAQDLVEHAVRVNDFLGIHLNCSANGILRPPSGAALGQAPEATRDLALSCGSGLGSALPYLVLVLLMGFTTWYQQKQMQARQDPNSPQNAQMQMFGRIMPIMLMFFAFTFPTGVVLYWLTTNLWTIGQQRLMLHAAPELPTAGVDAARSGKGPTKPQSGKPPQRGSVEAGFGFRGNTREATAPSVEQEEEAPMTEDFETPVEGDVPEEETAPPAAEAPEGSAVREVSEEESVEPAAPDEVAEVAREFVSGLLSSLELEAEVTTSIEDETAFIDVAGDNLGGLIGRRGQTLDSLQEIVRTAVQRKLRSRVRLLVDVEGYRARRRTSLVEYATEMAERAKERGTEIELEPMSAYERKIVHQAVAEIDGASSFSEGEEPTRKVVIRGD